MENITALLDHLRERAAFHRNLGKTLPDERAAASQRGQARGYQKAADKLASAMKKDGVL